MAAAELKREIATVAEINKILNILYKSFITPHSLHMLGQ